MSFGPSIEKPTLLPCAIVAPASVDSTNVAPPLTCAAVAFATGRDRAGGADSRRRRACRPSADSDRRQVAQVDVAQLAVQVEGIGSDCRVFRSPGSAASTWPAAVAVAPYAAALGVRPTWRPSMPAFALTWSAA